MLDICQSNTVAFTTRTNCSQLCFYNIGYISWILYHWYMYYVNPDCTCWLTVRVLYSGLKTGCETVRNNTDMEGGVQLMGVTTVEQCRSACIYDIICIAYMWDTTDSPERQCWIHTAYDATSGTHPYPGAILYELNRQCLG